MEGLKNHNESAFYKAIKRNPVAFFKPKAPTIVSKKNALKSDCQLFSSLARQGSVTWKNSSCMKTSQDRKSVV